MIDSPFQTSVLNLLDPKEPERHAFDLNRELIHTRDSLPNKQVAVYQLGVPYLDYSGYNQSLISTLRESILGTLFYFLMTRWAASQVIEVESEHPQQLSFHAQVFALKNPIDSDPNQILHKLTPKAL